MKRKIDWKQTFNQIWRNLRYSHLKKSIFVKYYIACASLILVSFLFLATAMFVLSVKYSSNQKLQLYLQNARSIAQTCQEMTNSPKDLSDMDLVLRIITPTIDASIFIVQNDGTILVGRTATIRNKVDIIEENMPSSIMKIVNSGKEYSETGGKLGGFYSRRYITEAVPIRKGDQITGGVFVSSRADNLISYISDIVRIFVICVLTILLLSFIAIYFLTSRLVKPLRQMSTAAKSFAKGDFSTRVPVSNNDEIGQLAVAFNNMAASLTSLEEMRRSFVANVSHELKTPMTTIAGFIDGILDGTIPDEKRTHYLTIVSNEVKRLSRLVRSFLDIARIEAGEIKVNPVMFDVEETIRRVIVGFEYPINEKQLTVKGLDENADRKTLVYADPDITHQIINNLVDNAVKFANQGGYLEVNVVDRDKKVYIGVKNSGMGIPKKDLPFVFERFYKTDKSRSSDRKGVGLGLYIVKTILNLQGEDIVVKSVEGEYCEFVFTLKKA